MVKKEQWKGKTAHSCESCGFGYETEDLAAKCERYCEEHHSCSLDITKHAVKTS